jgi:hypothetical protein
MVYISIRCVSNTSILAFLTIAILGYLFMHWLTFTTDHGNEIMVPNLSKLTEGQVEENWTSLDLSCVVR